MENAVSGIKICGITRACEAEWLNESGVEYAGFVFYEKSKRNISLALAKEISGKLNQKIIKVAVAVSPTRRQAQLFREAGFDILQVHGGCEEELLEAPPLPVWRAFSIEAVEREADWRGMAQTPAAGVLLDAGSFGSGRTFGWERGFSTGAELPEGELPEGMELPEWYRNFAVFRRRLRERNIPLILAGGLNSANVALGMRIFSPDIVDVSSGVEEPGEVFRGKSGPRIEEFVRAVRETDRRQNA